MAGGRRPLVKLGLAVSHFSLLSHHARQITSTFKACKTQKNYKHFQFTPVVPSSPTRCSPSSASSFGILFVVMMIGLVAGSGIFQPYGPVCPIECIGHIQKQMGSRLLKLTKDMKGKTVRGLEELGD